MYASIRGYFIRAQDFGFVAEKAEPLSVAQVAGPCEHVPTGWDGVGDGVSCISEAVSQVEVTGNMTVVIDEGSVARVAGGARTDTVDQRLPSRRGLRRHAGADPLPAGAGDAALIGPRSNIRRNIVQAEQKRKGGGEDGA